MLHIHPIKQGLEIYKALASEARLEIIDLLLKSGGMSMNELAKELKITNGAITHHMKMLEECGLITIVAEATGHGIQKKCCVCADKILIDIRAKEVLKDTYQTSIKVGHYSDYDVYPSCGIATTTALLGEVDDVRYFAHPDRYAADVLWFTSGYVEYIVPHFIPTGQRITQLTFSMELASEAPGYNNAWPSDIHFSLNGKQFAMWTSPGDFGGVKALYTPEWWYSNWGQYGLLKVLTINQEGSFIDGTKVSDVTIDTFALNYSSTLKLRLEVPKDAEHVGGLSIFGKGFGNYNQEINVKINYEPIAEEMYAAGRTDDTAYL